MGLERSIFVTGFPGFIAGRLVERLAGPETEFFLLVQPKFVEPAITLATTIADATGAALDNFAIVEGDISLPSLGIANDDLEEIAEKATDVFHLAAVYDLEVERDVALKVNVTGTENVGEFCRKLPGLRRYNYISTCYVAGKRTGRIPETELEHNAGFRNHYEESKYLAEMSVEALKDELPITIYRPSVVVGDSRTGETAKYDGIYSLVHYLLMSPRILRTINVGNNDVRLNLVPVDFVVDGIAALSADPSAEGKTAALADPEPLTTAELFDTLAESLTGKRSILMPPPGLVEWSLMLPFSPALTGLPHSGVPYFFLSQTYDTSVAVPLLAAHEIVCPGFGEYARSMVDFVREHPKL